jgi:hypothetical protein
VQIRVPDHFYRLTQIPIGSNQSVRSRYDVNYCAATTACGRALTTDALPEVISS